MDREEFIEQVRRGNTKFRVDDVKVRFPTAQLCGSGSLELSGDRFRLDVRLPGDAVPPDMPRGTVTQKDFGSLRGVIERDLQFESNSVPPHHRHSSHNGRSTLGYDLDAIELSPVGWDTLRIGRIDR